MNGKRVDVKKALDKNEMAKRGEGGNNQGGGGWGGNISFFQLLLWIISIVLKYSL